MVVRSQNAVAPARKSRTPPVRGFTLIELMVVIVILGLLTSIMIPVMSAASDSRADAQKRLLGTYISAAQARAVATGRPAAVIIQRMGNNSIAGMEVFLGEVPPPYIGDTLNSTAKLAGPVN